jgi:Protein of unknown function (DUF4235)
VAKLLYKPFGLAISILGGLVAGALFKKTWKTVAGEDDAPSATDADRGWGEIVLAAALEGAVFGVVKAALDRAGATGFAKATGVWPGNRPHKT